MSYTPPVWAGGCRLGCFFGPLYFEKVKSNNAKDIDLNQSVIDQEKL